MIVDLTTGTHTDVPYWQQERLVLKLTTTSDHVDLYDWADQNTPLATYLTADGVAEIDITDYVRANPTRNTYALTYDGAGTYWPISIVRAGMIDPAGMAIPVNETSGLLYPQMRALIIPPSKLIAGNEALGNVLMMEFYAERVNGVSWTYSKNGGQQTALANGVTDVSSSNLKSIQIFVQNTAVVSRNISERLCGMRYADIAWVSAAGINGNDGRHKMHTWEVRAQEIASANAFSLLDWDNAYNTVKGREDGFTLYLDELSEFDMWYYSDILTSSDVRLLALDEKTFVGNSIEECPRLEVVSKSVTLPNGTALGKLEIQVKYKRYDAVNL